MFLFCFVFVFVFVFFRHWLIIALYSPDQTIRQYISNVACRFSALNPPRRNTFRFAHARLITLLSTCTVTMFLNLKLYSVCFCSSVVYARKRKKRFQLNKRRKCLGFLLIIHQRKPCDNWFNCNMIERQHLVNIVWCSLLMFFVSVLKCRILKCAGGKWGSRIKSIIALVCIDGFSWFFH